MPVGVFLDKRGDVGGAPFDVATFTVACPGWSDFWGDGAITAAASPRRIARPFFKGLIAPSNVAQAARIWREIVAGNEPDNPLERYRCTPSGFGDWFEVVCLGAPDAAIWFPGPSGLDPNLETLRDPRVQEVIRRHAAGGALHLYGTREEVRRLIRLAREILGPDVKLACQELNAGWGRPPAAYGGSLAAWTLHELPGILDDLDEAGFDWTTYFALDWSQDDPSVGQVENLSAAGTPVLPALRAWAAGSIGGALADPLFPPAAPAPQEVPMLKFVDLSNNNGAVDMAKIKAAGYDGVIVKITEDDWGDDDFYDSFAAGFLAAARAVGLLVGVYTFLRPSKSSPAESVGLVESGARRLGGLRQGESVWFDMEDTLIPSGQSLHVWLAEGLALASDVFGVLIGKYSGEWYTGGHELEHPDLARHPSWWADYRADLPAPTTGWSPIRLWQRAVLDAGEVPGVQGACDVNVFYGTADDWRALGVPVDWPTANPDDLPLPIVPPPDPDAALTSALDNLWDLTLDSRLDPDREISAQRAIVALKQRLGR